MQEITFQLLQPDNEELIELVAAWYLQEWKIPVATTQTKLINLDPKLGEFHLVMFAKGVPVGTGGVHSKVNLVTHAPRFAIHKHWLALVYTTPECRGKGLGAVLCTMLQKQATHIGLKELYLYTHTAETLYQRLDWQPTERLTVATKEIVVMKKPLV